MVISHANVHTKERLLSHAPNRRIRTWPLPSLLVVEAVERGIGDAYPTALQQAPHLGEPHIVPQRRLDELPLTLSLAPGLAVRPSAAGTERRHDRNQALVGQRRFGRNPSGYRRPEIMPYRLGIEPELGRCASSRPR